MSIVQSRPARTAVRHRILEAAGHAFLERGYAGTAVADVAAEAGFTKGAVYSNFGGKPELFSAVFTERFASLADSAIAESELMTTAQDGNEDGHDPAPERIAASLADRIMTPSPWPALFAEFQLLAGRDQTVRQTYEQLRQRQAEDLQARLRDRADALGLSADFDFAAAAHLLLTTVNARALEFAVAPGTTPPDLMRASLTRLVQGLLS